MSKRRKGRNKQGGVNKRHHQQQNVASSATTPAPTGQQPTQAAPTAPAQHRSTAQMRAEHALARVNSLTTEADGYGNYASYVKALPARIIMNGLGQALAMERAGANANNEAVSIGHQHLYAHLQDWLLNGWQHGPYQGNDIIADLIAGGEQDYIRAQAESMAYLEWLKKFAVAFLNEPDSNGGEDAAAAP